MMKLIRFALLSLAFVLSGTAFGQSNLPACTGSDISRWSNCTGQVRTSVYNYSGAFLNGKFHGSGVMSAHQPDAKGENYVGDFKDGMFNGQGTHTFGNGEKYVGDFKDGKFNGQGTFTFINGEKHVGEYKDGKRNGLGTFTSLKGDKYFGEYEDGKRDGQGVTITADVGWLGVGIVLSEWIDGKEHGKFIRYNANKKIVMSGISEGGKIVSRQDVHPNDFNRIATSISDAFNELQERESQRLAEEMRRKEEDRTRRIAQIAQEEKEEIRKKLEYQKNLVIENNKKFGSTGVGLNLNNFDTECLRTLHGKGLGFGLCTMQGLDFVVSVSVRNNLNNEIKDIEIECKYISESGTDLTPTRFTRNKMTIYQRWTPGQIKDINFKIGGVQQTKNLNCKVLTWK